MKRLDRLKSAFLAQVSHKLNTPLTSLSLGFQELERYAANLYPGDPCHQRLSSMREDMAKFSAVIASLLKMQEVMVGHGGSRIRCDLSELVHEALAQVVSKNDQQSVTLDFNELPLILVDHDRLLFALQQVLDNAFKFSNPQGVISISLAQEDGMVRIRVEDNGCGIRKEELPKIFKQFYQVDPDETGQIPGFGLGLFCTREIIRQHSGYLTVDSSEGVGTAVTITLPLNGQAGSICQSVTSQAVVGSCSLCELFSDTMLFLPV